MASKMMQAMLAKKKTSDKYNTNPKEYPLKEEDKSLNDTSVDPKEKDRAKFAKLMFRFQKTGKR
jgi:hypothetical protein